MQKKLLFIVNPRAGKLRSRAPLFDAVSIFCTAGYLVSVMETAGRGDATQIAAKNGAEYDLVVCCGGDGTLSETVAGLLTLKKPPMIGYIPAGTTNDFASCIHLPKSPALAAKIAVGGIGKSVDIGGFNDNIFVYVASFGAFSEASYNASQSSKNALGPFAYFLEGIKDLTNIRPYSLKIEADGEILDGDYVYGSVSNSTSIGGFVKLDPNEVTMDDGKMELLLIRNPKNPIELQNVAAAFLSQHFDHKGIVYRHVSEIKIHTESNVQWALDGEFNPGATELSIGVKPRAITIMS